MLKTGIKQLTSSAQMILATSVLFFGSTQGATAKEVSYTCRILHEDGSKGKPYTYRLNTIINKGEQISPAGEISDIDDVSWGNQAVTVNIKPAGTGGRMLQILVIPLNGGAAKYNEIIDTGHGSPFKTTMRAGCIRASQ